LTRKFQLILSVFCVFCYQVGQVFISNIIFLFYFIFQTYKSGVVKFNTTASSRISLFCFLGYITLNTILYSVFIHTIDIRGLVQYLYNFQYLFLIIYVKLDYIYIEKIVFRSSLILSLLMTTHFFLSGDLIQLYKWNLFAINYLPGWSNTLPLYLVFALFINRKLKYPFYYSALLLFAIFLTDSRGSILGAIGVFVLPIARKFKKIIIIFLISILTIILIYVNVLIDLGGDIKFLRSFDRVDIFLTSISYIKQSWLFGYGGNTIEQLSYVKISHDPLQDWGHTHNFVLEFALRYGLIGLVLFILFLFFKIREIKDFDFRYLFILFIALAFFQTFMRDFTFLSILIILSHFRYFSNRELNIEESK
jgi:hypothetical protein